MKAAGPAQGQAHAANSNAQDVAADSAQKGRNNSTQRVFPDTSQLPNLLAGLGDEVRLPFSPTQLCKQMSCNCFTSLHNVLGGVKRGHSGSLSH